MSRGLGQQQRRILGLAYSVNVMGNGGTFRLAEGEMIPPGELLYESCRGEHADFIQSIGYMEKSGRYRVPAMVTDAMPEVLPRMAVHYVGGIPLSPTTITKSNGVETPATGMFASSPEFRSAKASITRAITRLERDGFLAFRPPSSQISRRIGKGSEHFDETTKIIRDAVLAYEASDKGYRDNELARAALREVSKRDRLFLRDSMGDFCGYVLTEKGAAIGVDHQMEVDPNMVAQMLEYFRTDVDAGWTKCGVAGFQKTLNIIRSGEWRQELFITSL